MGLDAGRNEDIGLSWKLDDEELRSWMDGSGPDRMYRRLRRVTSADKERGRLLIRHNQSDTSPLFVIKASQRAALEMNSAPALDRRRLIRFEPRSLV